MAATRHKAIKSVLFIIVIVGVAGGASYLLHVTRPEQEAREAPPRAAIETRVERLEKRLAPRSLRLLGTAAPVRGAVVSAEVSGNVVWVSEKCEPGGKAAAGEVLIRLDPEPYEIALAEAEAAFKDADAGLALQKIENETERRRLEQAESELKSARGELERTRRLRREGVVSQSELDRQESTFASVKKQYLSQLSRFESSDALLLRAEAAVARARAGLRRARMDVARSRLKAPFAGEIASREVSLGSRVGMGAPAFEIVDYSRVEVEVEIGSRYLELARPGARARLRALNGRVEREGELTHVSPKADAANRLFKARIMVENPGFHNKTAEVATPSILPGMFVEARLCEADPEPRIMLPFSAVTHDGDGEYIFVVKPGDATSGERSSGDHSPGADEAAKVSAAAEASDADGVARKVYVETLWTEGNMVAIKARRASDGDANDAPGGNPNGNRAIDLVGELAVVEGQDDLVDGAPTRILSRFGSRNGNAPSRRDKGADFDGSEDDAGDGSESGGGHAAGE